MYKNCNDSYSNPSVKTPEFLDKILESVTSFKNSWISWQESCQDSYQEIQDHPRFLLRVPGLALPSYAEKYPEVERQQRATTSPAIGFDEGRPSVAQKRLVRAKTVIQLTFWFE